MSDIRNLVERIVEALGPDVTPQRVEAVAHAVLDERQGPALSNFPQSPVSPGHRVLITAYGYDKPGILAAITQAVSDTGCNILDVSQKILQGYFTLIMLADTTNVRKGIPALQDALHATGDRINVRILVQHEDLFHVMHRP